MSGGAVFSDSACSMLLKAEMSDIYCNHGYIGSCTASANTFSGVPNTGAKIYSNADCSSLHPDNMFQVQTTCVDGNTLVCGGPLTNTTTDVVYTSYATNTCTGTATVNIFSNNVCTAYGDSYVKASCSLTPSGSSASTASVSFVAMIVASLVAVFARSL
jgi:hypothetical protein